MKYICRATANTDYDRMCQRIDELQVLIAEQRHILSMKENEQINFRQLYDDERQILFDDQGVLKQHEDSLRRQRSIIQQLKAAKQDRITIYGRYTIAILQDIQKYAHKFKQIPIGPVGKISIDIRKKVNYELIVDNKEFDCLRNLSKSR